jgi:effector-binding domain-containing protein
MAFSEVQVGHHDSIPLAVVRRQARASELPKVVPEGCGVVWSYIRARQLRGGRHVAVYWDGAIRLEVGVEVIDPVPEGGHVVRSGTPAGRVASVAHFGPYQQLGSAHQAIRDWCSARNLKFAGPNWEIYDHWQDDWNANPSRIRTDVFYLLAPDSSSPAC